MHKGVGYALLAAALFGASTPLAKTLLGHVSPVMLAGLLYLGSGIVLSVFYLVRALVRRAPAGDGARLVRADLPWLVAAIAAGGIAGPVLLMAGLAVTPASSASLLLNMEGALTALLAWFVFKENFDRRIFIGMLLIVLAGGLLSWDQMPAFGVPWGALAIIGACLCWGVDNNLTRKVSASDAVQIAAIKGLVAGAVNLALALSLGQRLPAPAVVMSAGAVGLAGYGVSLVLFVVALRHLGTARTGAYFAAAPFVGAALSLLMLREVPGAVFWIACALMAIGIWLHLTESHEHSHTHEALAHAHEHTHDEHHQHTHDVEWDGSTPHAHAHRHTPLTHAHHHAPDIHHRHEH
jgi:drug/metabolite transporter (DMT)-like permease